MDDVNVAAFRRQAEVLADPTVSVPAKLMFCRLMCQAGFRGGWIVDDSRWTDDDHSRLRELARAGYVTLSHHGVRLTPSVRESA
jgi:hypothetical protein